MPLNVPLSMGLQSTATLSLVLNPGFPGLSAALDWPVALGKGCVLLKAMSGRPLCRPIC